MRILHHQNLSPFIGNHGQWNYPKMTPASSKQTNPVWAQSFTIKKTDCVFSTFYDFSIFIFINIVVITHLSYLLTLQQS